MVLKAPIGRESDGNKPPQKNGIYRSRVLDGSWLHVQWLWQPPKLMDVLRAWQLI